MEIEGADTIKQHRTGAERAGRLCVYRVRRIARKEKKAQSGHPNQDLLLCFDSISFALFYAIVAIT